MAERTRATHMAAKLRAELEWRGRVLREELEWRERGNRAAHVPGLDLGQGILR